MTHSRALPARLPKWLACAAAAWLWLAALGVVALGMSADAARAQDVLPVPALSGRVIDQTGTLSAAQAEALSAKLAAIESKHGSQLVVLLVPTTQPEDIAAYAQRVGDAWKIGRRDVGDGLIVVVAKNDRKVRIEVAKALEGAVPDLAARRIISEIVTPAFRGGDFAGGLNAAVDAIGARIAGEALPEPAQASRDSPRGLLHGFDLQDLAIFVFFAVPIIGAVARAILGRKLGAAAAGGVLGAIAWGITASVLIGVMAAVVALVMTALGGLGAAASRRGRGGPVIFGGGGWSSGGGGWGSGGGWSSGGGGDFGGGGASGDW